VFPAIWPAGPGRVAGRKRLREGQLAQLRPPAAKREEQSQRGEERRAERGGFLRLLLLLERVSELERAIKRPGWRLAGRLRRHGDRDYYLLSGERRGPHFWLRSWRSGLM
jgi:hypothetical protein